jgi:hypothetical protein
VTLADISILRTSSPFDYRCPLDWLPTSRLLPPRSGLERSDLVRCAGFSDAGVTRPTTRWCGRRPRSAKARSRGRLGRGDAASYGIWPRRVIRKSACK